MTSTPDVLLHRKFVYTDLVRNNNKIWEIKVQSDGTMVRTYGRVGKTQQVKAERGNVTAANKLCAEKLKEGYKEVDLHKTIIQTTHNLPAVSNTDPAVIDLLTWFAAEAGQQIKQTLAGPVDALSEAQIDRGQKKLAEIELRHRQKRHAEVIQAVQEYYQIIPTQLPPKIKMREVVESLLANMLDEYNRLYQLRVELQRYTITRAGGSMTAALGGLEINPVSAKSKLYQGISAYFERTKGREPYKVQRVFTITIPSERAAWDAETKGKDNITSLWHGTRATNAQHIITQGFVILPTAANGSRFGRGIYLADRAERALQYSSSSKRLQQVLFLCDAALGRMKKDSGSNPSWDEHRIAPYDSVWGTGTWSNHGDEFVIYRASQQTMRAIVVVG